MGNLMYIRIVIFVVCLTTSWGADLGVCMQPEEILVVANHRMAESEALARYYMGQRGIPESHLLSLSLTLNETMSRKEYDSVLKKQVIETLKRLSRICS